MNECVPCRGGDSSRQTHGVGAEDLYPTLVVAVRPVTGDAAAEDDPTQVLDQGPEAVLALAQPLGRLPLLGHIPAGATIALEAVAAVQHRFAGDTQNTRSPGIVLDRIGEAAERPPCCQISPVGRPVRAAKCRAAQLLAPAPKHFFGRQAGGQGKAG